MEEELDPFDFTFALELGMTVDQMQKAVPNGEYIAWRAYYVWRKAQLELAMKEPQ
jgi:hypothetical protein